MVDRLLKLPKKHSFFLFGARSSGKSTLLKQCYNISNKSTPIDVLYIDLLDPDLEEKYQKNPNLLKEEVSEKSRALKSVIVDEIQKVPALLDVIHGLIESFKNIQFVMTGSSARKLKRGSANLLGGRAFSFKLHPFTHLEAPNKNNLNELLRWGTIPKIYDFDTNEDKIRFLRGYTQTYLKEEIQLEQIVRNISSFRQFLEVAAQCSGQIINFSKISKQTGVDEKTIARYFEILTDTLIGFYLESFNYSVRARQAQKPKFYFFDSGVQRFIAGFGQVELSENSADFGKSFEQFIILECIRLNDYYEKDFEFSYLRVNEDAEVDLIIKKPGNKLVFIEIKSKNNIIDTDYKHLSLLGKDFPKSEKIILCNETKARKTEDGIRILPWRQGLTEIFQ